MLDFLKAKFEILLMAAFVLLYTGCVAYGAIWGRNGIIDFAADNNKLFVGALLGALTGRAISATMTTRSGDNPNGGPTSPPSPSTGSQTTTLVVDSVPKTVPTPPAVIPPTASDSIVPPTTEGKDTP